MPDINNLASYEFQSNPYMDMLGGGEQQMPQQPQQGMPQGMPQGGQPQMANPNQSMGQAEAQGTTGQIQSQLNQGQNPDNLRPLISATQGLEKFITESTSKEDIILARGIISAISRLISRAQDSQMKELG